MLLSATSKPANIKSDLPHYSVSGKGSVIVLLHGFLGSSDIWKSYARRLKESFKVITIDLPGHGNSETTPLAHSIDGMAEGVRNVIKSLEIRSCVLVGHSMGGYVTLAFAEKYPRLLKGFVLYHSQAAADSPDARVNRDRTIALVQKDHQGFIKNFIPDLFDPDNVVKLSKEIDELKDMSQKTPKEGIIAALEAMKNRPDRQHVLLNAKIPVLFIIGKSDKRIPMEIIIPQTLLPEHSEMILLDHVGHMGFLEAPGKTFSAIKSFAERLLR
jgi:pimeloyl-ACP methyl ester carboxylesterase